MPSCCSLLCSLSPVLSTCPSCLCSLLIRFTKQRKNIPFHVSLLYLLPGRNTECSLSGVKQASLIMKYSYDITAQHHWHRNTQSKECFCVPSSSPSADVESRDDTSLGRPPEIYTFGTSTNLDSRPYYCLNETLSTTRVVLADPTRQTKLWNPCVQSPWCIPLRLQTNVRRRQTLPPLSRMPTMTIDYAYGRNISEWIVDYWVELVQAHFSFRNFRLEIRHTFGSSPWRVLVHSPRHGIARGVDYSLRTISLHNSSEIYDDFKYKSMKSCERTSSTGIATGAREERTYNIMCVRGSEIRQPIVLSN